MAAALAIEKAIPTLNKARLASQVFIEINSIHKKTAFKIYLVNLLNKILLNSNHSILI